MIYTGSGNVPYVQSGSIEDFIPEPRCSKSIVGLQTRRRNEGCTRGPVGSDRKGRGRPELRYELGVQAYARGVASYRPSESKLKENRPLPVGGSASPFIEEGDGFTSERERVRTLLSLVAHTDEDNIMVGAHNTVDVTVDC